MRYKSISLLVTTFAWMISQTLWSSMLATPAVALPFCSTEDKIDINADLSDPHRIAFQWYSTCEYSAFNVSVTNGPQYEAAGGHVGLHTITNVQPGSTYSVAVQGCFKHFLSRSTCHTIYRKTVTTKVAIPAPASASASAPLNVCNETGERMSVALAYFENNSWNTQGWFTLPKSECKGIHNSLENTRFYLYAHSSSSSKTWEANHAFCIVQPTAFTLKGAERTSSCNNVKKFFSIWTPDPITGKMPASYTYTFGPNNVNLNNPRAER